jgi:phage gpG-like protein
MSKQIDFERIKQNIAKMERRLPILLSNEMLNHSKNAFRDQGFTDETLSVWQKRKTSNRADRRTKKKRFILVDSGALRRSLAKRKATFKEIAVGSYGIKYAARHNRGLAGMPERKFVGKSKRLNQKLTDIARKEFAKIFE